MIVNAPHCFGETLCEGGGVLAVGEIKPIRDYSLSNLT